MSAEGAESNHPQIIALLRGVRDHFIGDSLFRAFTAESVAIIDEATSLIVVQRLKQIAPQYPLLHISIYERPKELPAFLSALSASTTLTSFKCEDDVPSTILPHFMKRLKSVPTLRSVDIESKQPLRCQELLQTRTNWTFIRLFALSPKLTACVTANRTDFELHLNCVINSEQLNRCLANQHLTALYCEFHSLPAKCVEALGRCQNLTRLVTPSHLCRRSVTENSFGARFAAHQILDEDSAHIPARHIPRSVVYLKIHDVKAEQLQELLTTRDQRALQRVHFCGISDCKTAALAAELVCTDPKKQWKYSGSFGPRAGSAFCSAAMRAQAASGVSSLIDLEVTTVRTEQAMFASLLCKSPNLTRYVVLSEVKDVLLACGQTEFKRSDLCWCVVSTEQ
jgi:hypothetical protein